jgi:hypothetical protein
VAPIHYKDSQDSRRHPYGTRDVQGYGEVVQESTPSHGKDLLYQRGATSLRCRRARHPGDKRKQHRLHKEIDQI